MSPPIPSSQGRCQFPHKKPLWMPHRTRVVRYMCACMLNLTGRREKNLWLRRLVEVSLVRSLPSHHLWMFECDFFSLLVSCSIIHSWGSFTWGSFTWSYRSHLTLEDLSFEPFNRGFFAWCSSLENLSLVMRLSLEDRGGIILSITGLCLFILLVICSAFCILMIFLLRWDHRESWCYTVISHKLAFVWWSVSGAVWVLCSFSFPRVGSICISVRVYIWVYHVVLCVFMIYMLHPLGRHSFASTSSCLLAILVKWLPGKCECLLSLLRDTLDLLLWILTTHLNVCICILVILRAISFVLRWSLFGVSFLSF